MSSTQPSVSLHITNLNHQIPKTEIRRGLYGLFSLYGKVLDVVHTRSARVRGTGFIVFRDLASSTQALRALDGDMFYGRQLRITYATSTSHATVALHEGPEAVYAIKLGLRTADGKATSNKKVTVSSAGNRLVQEQNTKRAREAGEAEEEEEEEEDESDEGEPEAKKQKEEEQEEDDDAMEEETDSEEEAPTTTKAAALGPPQPAPSDVPNPVLFASGLPQEVTSDMLSPLFQQYPGLASIKMLPAAPGPGPNRGLAFVHYEATAQAGTAREALDGFLLAKETPMAVAFAARA